MRYAFVAAVAAFSMWAVPQASGQGLSITNYQYVSEQRISQTQSYVTYRASLVNTGAARSAVTATVSSSVASVRTIPGQTNLHFSPVPANSTVVSSNTFMLQVDRTVLFDFANIAWTFTGPVANAGTSKTAGIGAAVTLDGSGSSNPSGAGALTYSWAFSSRPAGSAATLQNPTTVSPSFTVDVAGNYVILLTVSNGVGSDSASVTVSTTNTPPVANAGQNQTVAVGATVRLTGAGSTDVDGDPLTYSWLLISKPAASAATLLSANTVSPSFVADKATNATAGFYVAQLTVNDGKANSAPVTVTISTSNTKPVAVAGAGQTVNIGTLVQLNGSGSFDVDGNSLTYAWTLNAKPAGSTAALSSTTSINPSFTADKGGNYQIQLIVNDGQLNSDPSTVTVSTNAVQKPIANAGSAQTVTRNSTVTLNGAASSDPQGLALTYAWSFTSKAPNSTATLTNPTTVSPTFVADQPGQYVVQLIVNNGLLPSDPVTVTITTTNSPPTAAIGVNPGTSVPLGTTVTLDGTISTDPDHDTLTYAWALTQRPVGSTAALSSITAAKPTLFIDVIGNYQVQLIVNDGAANSLNTATVLISAGSNTVSLAPNPLNITMGSSGTLTLTLGVLAGASGQAVNLASDHPAVAGVPPTVTVPAGSSGTNVTVTPGTSTGSATITASAANFQSGTSVVNVSANTITVTLDAATVGITRTINGTITLSAPAASGVAVTLAATPSGIVTVPATVNVAPNATTGTFTVTGVAAGAATIQATATNYTSGSATVTAQLLGAITLPSAGPLVIGTKNVPFAVTLSSAATAPVTVALVSSDPAKVSISDATVIIPTGQTTPTAQPTISALAPGSATITASAGGYTGATTQPIQVTAALSFSPQNPNISVGVATNLTLSLNGPAPSGGLPVTLQSSDTNVATVTSPVTIAAGQTSVQVPVTGVAPGPATITATSPNVTNGTVNVTVQNAGTVILPSNTTLALGQSSQYTVSVNAAPAADLAVTLSSSASTIVSVPSTVIIRANTTSVAATINGLATGSATISATAPGYTAATPQAVTVNATLTFSTPAAMVVGATQNLTLTLSGPAPTAGIVVTLSPSSGAVTLPAQVSFAAGETQKQVAVVGASVGQAVITAHTSAPNIPDATATVNVGSAGTITVSSPTVGLGGTGTLTITLSQASPAPLTVNLASTAKATLSANTVNFTGTTTQQQVTVTGVDVGSATVTATANGWTTGTGAVTIGATLSLNGPLSITGTGTASLTLTLSANTPGGLTVNLNTNPTGIATLPATAAFAAGTNTATVQVQGVTAGNTTIHASGTNIPDATAAVTVTSANLPALTVGSVSVGKDLQTFITISIPSAAGADVSIAVTSSDSNKVRLGNTGATTITPTLTAGSTSLQILVQGIDSLGTANITATANGYTNGTGTVTLTPSGFVLLLNNSNAANQAATYQTFVGAITPIAVSSARLDSSTNNFAEFQAIRAGIASPVSVLLTSSLTANGTVSPGSLSFGAGDSSKNASFTAVAANDTVVSVSASGFTTPGGNAASVTMNISSSTVVLPAVSVGYNLEATIQIGLGGGSAPTDTIFTVSVADSSKALLAVNRADAGSQTINLKVTGPNSAPFFVIGKASSGTVSYSVTSTMGNASNTITFFPSAITVGPSSGIFGSVGGTQTVTVASNYWDGSVLTFQEVGGTAVSVPVTSDNAAVGTIDTSPVSILPGTGTATTEFRPQGGGNTVVRAGTPTGFIAAPFGSSIPASVSTNKCSLTSVQAVSLGGTYMIGQHLQQVASATLLPGAPAGGLDVVMTSTVGLLLATSPTAAGTSSITVRVAGGATNINFYMQAVGNAGVANLTCAPPGYASATGSTDLAPSGVVLYGPSGFDVGSIAPIPFSAPTPVTASTFVLDPSTLAPLAMQPLAAPPAGSSPLAVQLTTTDASKGTVPASLSITPGNDSASFTFTGLATGSVTLRAVPPGGYATPGSAGFFHADATRFTINLNP